MRLVTYPDSILTTPASPCNDPIPPFVIEKMAYLIRKHKAWGLAAPQVGLGLSFFLLDAVALRVIHQVYVNPKITSQHSPLEPENESCLSLPGVSVAVQRYGSIRLSFKDRRGNAYELDFYGNAARVIQHEVDHLLGKLIAYPDKVESSGTEVAIEK